MYCYEIVARYKGLETRARDRYLWLDDYESQVCLIINDLTLMRSLPQVEIPFDQGIPSQAEIPFDQGLHRQSIVYTFERFPVIQTMLFWYNYALVCVQVGVGQVILASDFSF